MDFSQFESVDNTHERKGGYTLVKEQAYDGFKYRKAPKKQKQKDGSTTEVIEGRIYISNAMWNKMGLATNGLHQFTAPDGTTIIAVVADKDAAILKMSKKSKNGEKVKNFKSPKLELALEKLKLIDTNKLGENQFLDLTSVATNVTIKGVSVIEAFTFSVGKAKEKVATPVEKLAEGNNTAAPAAKVEEAAAATKGDWD